MSQSGSLSSSGGGGGISSVQAGTGISVSTLGTTATVTNTGIINYTTPVIDFTQTGLTLIFTSVTGKSFAVIGYAMVQLSSTLPVYDNFFNIGFTPALYNDISTIPLALSNGFDNSSQYFTIGNLGQQGLLVPSATPVYVNITTADTGTALTGRIALQGFYF